MLIGADFIHRNMKSIGKQELWLIEFKKYIAVSNINWYAQQTLDKKRKRWN